MKYTKLFIFILFLLSINFIVYAQENCFEDGYTVLTINGIFTNQKGAVENRDSLKDHLPAFYNNEKVVVDYLYNSTHLSGFGDLVDVVRQGLFDSNSDFDLVEMLNDASEKVKTQKILVVGHSQGNFYANNFYDKIAGIEGGVPKESVGVYGVASPSDRVAGGGRYLTSDTDSVIASLVGKVKKIMAPNTHIKLSKADGNGHSFSGVYLKYRGDQIVSDIKSSLNNLSSNQIQTSGSLCISPQKISLGHKIKRVVVGAADLVVKGTVMVGDFTYNKIAGTFKSVASLFGNKNNKNLAAAGLFEENTLPQEEVQPIINETPSEEVVNTTNDQTLVEPKPIILNTEETSIPVVVDPIINPEEPIVITEIPLMVEAPVVNNNSGGGGGGGGGGGSNTQNTTTEVVEEEAEETEEATEAVIADIVPPVITLVGESSITIYLNALYVDAGATALDDKDGVVAVGTSGVVDTTIVGSYVLTYTAVDAANNIATSTRFVNVINEVIVETPAVDIVAPVITLSGENIININLNDIYTDAGATALDDKDGVLAVVFSGVVDTTIVGSYVLTYTATDTANNIATLIRTVNVVNNAPVASTTATLSLPNTGAFASDGLDNNRGRKNLTPFTFEIIYTDSNNAPAKNVKLHIKNTTTEISLSDLSMNKIVSGSDVLSDGIYSNGEIYTTQNTFDKGDYTYSFSADDQNGNYTKIEDINNFRFSAIDSTYTYIPKSSFGMNNGDGKDWQVWAFNGSNIYDWTDTYVNNYLREQFKIQAYSGGFWCSQCLQRGIFNHDPQKGFEIEDLITSSLENNTQNRMNGTTYDVAIQWDSTGYTYTISHGSTRDATGHTDVVNMNNDLWVGWDGSFNNFKTFPSGDWHGITYASPMERTGGGSMVLQPYPVYNLLAVQSPAPAPAPAPVLSSEKSITAFSFESLNPAVNGFMDESGSNIELVVPYGTIVSSLVPTITISEKSSILPISTTPQDFTNQITYIVKAEDETTSSYIVTVLISENPNPTPDPETTPDPIVPDNTAPTITSYTLNGTQNSITINPLINNLEIVLNSNKNVNWLTVKIEKESDASIYKILQSNLTTCIDGTKVCSKIWDGLLSSGGLLQSGNYKIRVHTKDSANREYEEYLSSIISIDVNKLD
ncbi:MAG: DUF5011 domain-containing protein [Candidatus Pacebacteria bacterium]|nr:DUF5011 domain-containing protein [Candidatus Paceibacterota bacterium]